MTETVKTVTVKENGVYFAPENPTEYIAKTYEDLTASLSKDEPTQAQAAAAYFLADFFTLKNKEEESDVGGMDLIPSASADAFLEYAKYYYYHVLPVIRTRDGEAALPEVTDVKLSAGQPVKVKYEEKEYPGYTYDVQLAYAESEESSEFKTTAKCTIIRMDDVHYVDKADVTSQREAGEPAEVWRITAVTNQ